MSLTSYFNPRSSCEERLEDIEGIIEREIFQSTLLMRGATRHILRRDGRIQFQSTLLMRGATGPFPHQELAVMISIHAPHARSDGNLGLVIAD